MKNQVFPKHQSSFGEIDANVLALLVYLVPAVLSFLPNVGLLFTWFIPLMVYLFEKNSKFVKFHAAQSFVLNIVGTCINILVTIIGILVLTGGILSNEAADIIGGASIMMMINFAVNILVFIYAIFAMSGAYKNTQYQIPIIGKIAVKFSGIDE
ncbi:Uncharacterized membrane protein [Granulicatella balaenopterae]|uniref:Uncharacterized membrane protein n=1 Tax=Granulicatella balaenopterae TaxID=137733 RepID=A0A1H9NNA3_9LACT|nr:DUF4870 domain-containing protein [Granulicatella balaenopterae]SER37119.1 Uncharacterized membrane protein [Granulicatella balaenopterae]